MIGELILFQETDFLMYKKEKYKFVSVHFNNEFLKLKHFAFLVKVQ